jgi:uncharacterized membrane protein
MLTASGQPNGVTVTFSPASITGSGTSSVGFQVAGAMAAGVYPITVTGTSGSLVQTMTIVLTVPVPPTFALSASAVSLTVGAGSSGRLTLSSSATGGFSSPIALSVSGQPAGVTPNLSTASIAASGVVTLNVSVARTAAAGSYPLTITGVGGSVTERLTVTLLVTGAPQVSFALSLNSTALTVNRGTSHTYTLQTMVMGSPAPMITLGVSGLPSGVTARFSPTTINGTGRSTVTVTAAATATRGTRVVTFTGTAGATSHGATVSLSVK